MTNICRYSIIRFRPFSETGEFANVGIIAVSLDDCELHYELAPRRFRRVTQFFDDLNGRLYSTAIDLLKEELAQISLQAEARAQFTASQLFEIAVLKKESMFTFSEVRTARFTGELHEFVTKLFERYVKRSFISAKHHEYLMVREIRRHLWSINITDFKEREIEDELMPVRFPLVSVRNDTHVIKPLAFDQTSSLAILDHEAQWRNRLEHLIDRGRLKPANILIPTEGPKASDDGRLREAYNLALSELARLNIAVVNRKDVKGLREFALRATRSPDLLIN